MTLHDLCPLQIKQGNNKEAQIVQVLLSAQSEPLSLRTSWAEIDLIWSGVNHVVVISPVQAADPAAQELCSHMRLLLTDPAP